MNELNLKIDEKNTKTNKEMVHIKLRQGNKARIILLLT